jgi:ABC-type uncharacterized transport system substrate-binding protein
MRRLTFCLALLGAPLCAQEQARQVRIFHLDSYDPSYAVSADTARGIQKVLAGKPVELKTFYLDTKRHDGDAEIKKNVEAARQAIAAFQPDVLIASDDAAVKYVVVPFFKGGSTPVVFCGVNWSAEPYGLPAGNVTGMVEIFPAFQVMDLARRYYPDLRRVAVLSEDSLSEQQNRAYIEPRFKSLGYETEYVLVGDYAAWKAAVLRLQQHSDVLYLLTQAAIKGWDTRDARAFLRQNLTKPVVVTDDFMGPYGVFGLVKDYTEQGEYAAATALRILAGTRPDQIPLARNRRRSVMLNPVLARKIGFRPGPDFEGAKRVE